MAMTSQTDYVTHEEATALACAFFNKPNVRVVDFGVGDFGAEKLGYLADHKLLTIKVRRGGGSAEPELCSFFLKAIAPDCSDFDRFVFKEEREFFRDALPRLLDGFVGEAWAPGCHLTKDELLVLEDLRARGYRNVGCDRLTASQLKTATASVARFHACSLLLQAKLDERGLPNALAERFSEKVFVDDNGGLAWKWLAAGIQVAESVATDLNLHSECVPVAYDAMLKRMGSTSTTTTTPPLNVLAHQDLWCNNMMFSQDDRSCLLVDFQMVAYGSFAIDLLQLMYLNTNRDMRQQLEQQLVQHYHSVLSKTLDEHGLDSGSVCSLDSLKQTVEEKRICGLVMAVQYFPISLLNKQLAKEYCQDSSLFQRYSYVSRRDFVHRAMQSDQHYRHRLQESVGELVEFMQHFQNA